MFLGVWPLVEASDPVDRELIERISEENKDTEIRVVGLGRARISHPQLLSGALGAIVSRQPEGYDCRTVCEFRGFLMQAEPGLGGGQLSAGYAIVNGIMGPDAHFLSHVYVGYGIKGALLRSWGNSSLDPEDQTLLGVEGELTFIGFNFSLGLFRHAGSGDPDDPWVVTGGMGWGF
jgi:hypothetical protein